MNRHIKTDQNNISKIIENLPKRLQKKIANDINTSSSHAQDSDVNVPNLSSGRSEVRYQNESEVLRSALKSKSCPIEQHTTNERKVKEETTEVTSIPGILRIPPVNATLEENICDPEVVYYDKNKHTIKCGTTTTQIQSKHKRPPWFIQLIKKNISYANTLPQLHDDLLEIIHRNSVLEDWQKFYEYHKNLQETFSNLLLHHLKFCCEQKVESYFWKLLFYNVIEHLKNINSVTSTNQTVVIINSGLQFYENLLSKLSIKYSLTSGHPHHRFELIAKVSAQKLLICLGDLSRYKSKYLNVKDFSEASNYYQRAQKLIPTNGIPYNQLAILSIYNRKKFDAIYYHMRSLMSSNAIYSAKESLQVLFDEIRKKYEENELKTSTHSDINKESKSVRKEVWISADRARRFHRTELHINKSTSSEEVELNKLITEELLRRFTSLYLYVIGKLFTGIGMETVNEHQRKLLILLSVILERNPFVFSSHRLLKMVALNIFIMEHNKQKDTRREIRYHAFIFCNQMFGLLLRKTNVLLTEYISVQLLGGNIVPGLYTLLQYSKIWCDWLRQNVDVWEAIRYTEIYITDPWIELKLLFSNIETILNTAPVSFEIDTIILDEDIFLKGFNPISDMNIVSLEKSIPNEEVQFYARIITILHFRKLFREHQCRLVSINDNNFRLEELNSQMKNALASVESTDVCVDDADKSDNIAKSIFRRNDDEYNMLNSLKEPNADSIEVSELSKLKKELEAKTNVNKMYTDKLEQQILKYMDTKFYIEVRPKYLLLDTNCFIDFLDDFEVLIKDHIRYILIIPLTVVKELDGLSKGVKIESYEMSWKNSRIHHFDDVSTRAKKSLNFIKTTNNNVKCATTKGSIINPSLFALVEEEHVSNDDKILATALALSKTMSTETKKDGKCFLQTELVLITTDRNLRVKALSRNLAVCELSEFQQWANDCKKKGTEYS